MIVRRLEKSEKGEAARIAGICFHARVEDPEERLREAERSEDEIFGAFDEQGRLAGSIINNHLVCRFRGREVMCGGIGAVSSLPEFREKGVIRSVFGALLPAARERGEVLSALYPFSHEFYRKFGYETVLRGREYDFVPEQLRHFHAASAARLWREGEDVSAFTRVYNNWAKELELSVVRNDERMREQHVSKKYWKDRRFCYLLGPEGNENAYLVFDDIYHDPAAILSVREAAWTDREGFLSILSLLGRFSADFGNIRWTLPVGIDLTPFLRDPYSVSVRPCAGYMLRVMNTQKLLSCLAAGCGARFTLKAEGDEQLPENNGVFRIDGDSVARDDTREADLVLNMRALAQLSAGSVLFDTCILREDVRLAGNREEAEKLFRMRKVYVGDAF